jgi:ABC-type transporter Mla MlaB component
MLTIKTLIDGRNANLIVHGDLTENDVFELEKYWRHTSSCESVQIDLCEVGTIDDAGKALLARMFAEGVGLVVGTQSLCE